MAFFCLGLAGSHKKCVGCVRATLCRAPEHTAIHASCLKAAGPLQLVVANYTGVNPSSKCELGTTKLGELWYGVDCVVCAAQVGDPLRSSLPGLWHKAWWLY